MPIGARALGLLGRYLDEVRPLFSVDEAEDALFLSDSGAPLHADTLTHRVGMYVEAAKIDKRGSCHLFRHTMATLMLEGGADVRLIQEILGHSSLESTQIYTRVSIRHLTAVHAATHPAERGPTVASTTPAGRANEDAAGLLTSLAAEAREELAG